MNARKSRTDWLDLALSELSAKGPDALKLEAICEAAGLTKGSFYHHFTNHASFLIACAEHWEVVQTDTLLDRFDMDDPDIEGLFRQIDHLASRLDGPLEISIRELARRVPEVADIVRATDEKRLSVGTKMYQKRYDAPEALARQIAALDYAAYSGSILMNPDMTHDDHTRLAELFRAMADDFLSGR